MNKFLLDANLSPKLIKLLHTSFGFDVVQITISKFSDEDVIKVAKQENRVIITFDKDFAETYHFKEQGKVGIIAFKLSDQTTENVWEKLKVFFGNESKEFDLNTTLIIIEDKKLRIIR